MMDDMLRFHAPGSNIRSWRSRSGNVSGFDNYGTTPARQALYDDVMETNRQWSQPQAAPSPSDMLMRQYRPQFGAQDFAAQMSGDVPVGLSMRQMARDPRWLKMYQENPEAATQVYQRAHGVTPEEDSYAEKMGFKTLAQLRAATGGGRDKQDKDYLSGLESNFGFNPGLLMQNQYDDATETLRIPGGKFQNRDTLDWEDRPETSRHFPRAFASKARDAMARRNGFENYAAMQSAGAAQPGGVPIEQAAAARRGADEAARKRFEELHKKRQPAQLIPDENAGYWGGM